MAPNFPVAAASQGLFDACDLQTLCAYIRVSPRAYAAIVLIAKARARAELIARQRRALLTVLARRQAATDFAQLALSLSTPGALDSWSVASRPADPSSPSDLD